MRRRDPVQAHHPHSHRAEQRLRQQRRRRRLRSMLMASAAFVGPTVEKLPIAKPARAPQATSSVATQPVGAVTTSASFRLSPKSPYDELIREAAKRYSLSPALIRAVILTESAFNPGAVSSAGAQGLMQIMPALADELGIADAFDPRENVMAGAKYLSALLEAQNGNLGLALASYNAGPGAVQRYQGIPPFKETQRYVKAILDLVADSEETPE